MGISVGRKAFYLRAGPNRCTITFIRQSNILISNYPMVRLGNQTDACREGAFLFSTLCDGFLRLVSCVCNLNGRARVCEKIAGRGNCMHIMSAHMQML